MKDRINYKIENLDICPDCGGDLDGVYCDECKSKWSFVKDEIGEKQNENKKKTKNLQ